MLKLRRWIVLVLFVGLIALGLVSTFMPMMSPTKHSTSDARTPSEKDLSQATLQR